MDKKLLEKIESKEKTVHFLREAAAALKRKQRELEEEISRVKGKKEEILKTKGRVEEEMKKLREQEEALGKEEEEVISLLKKKSNKERGKWGWIKTRKTKRVLSIDTLREY